MVFVPFIYFLLMMLFFWLKSRRWSVDVAATSVIVLISFFAILIDVLNLYGEGYGLSDYSINIGGVLLFCVEWSVVLSAFHQIAPMSILPLPDNKKFLFKVCAAIVTLCIIIFYVGNYEKLVNTLSIGSWSDIKSEHYEDLDADLQTTGRNIFMYLPSLVNATPIATIALLLWFYSITQMKNSWWLNAGLLLVSVSQIVMALITAGRAAIVYWILEFYLCTSLFWPVMSAVRRKRILRIFIGIGCIIVLLFVAITTSRFGDDSVTDALNSVYAYTGQPLNNLCSFVEYGQNAPTQIGRIFPLTYKLMGGHFNLKNHYDNISHVIGISVNRFGTFGGALFLDLGVIAVVVFLFLWILMVNKHFAKIQELSLPELILVGILVAFFTRSIFGWPFVGHYTTGGLLFALLLYVLFRYTFVIKR